MTRSLGSTASPGDRCRPVSTGGWDFRTRGRQQLTFFLVLHGGLVLYIMGFGVVQKPCMVSFMLFENLVLPVERGRPSRKTSISKRASPGVQPGQSSAPAEFQVE